MVILPLTADQFDSSARAEAIGIGTRLDKSTVKSALASQSEALRRSQESVYVSTRRENTVRFQEIVIRFVNLSPNGGVPNVIK